MDALDTASGDIVPSGSAVPLANLLSVVTCNTPSTTTNIAKIAMIGIAIRFFIWNLTQSTYTIFSGFSG